MIIATVFIVVLHPDRVWSLYSYKPRHDTRVALFCGGRRPIPLAMEPISDDHPRDAAPAIADEIAHGVFE